MKRFKGIAQWLSLFLLAVAVIAVYTVSYTHLGA